MWLYHDSTTINETKVQLILWSTFCSHYIFFKQVQSSVWTRRTGTQVPIFLPRYMKLRPSYYFYSLSYPSPIQRGYKSPQRQEANPSPIWRGNARLRKKRPLWVAYHARESIKRGDDLPPLCCWIPTTETSIWDLMCGHTFDYEWHKEIEKQSRGGGFFPPSTSPGQKHTFQPSRDERDCCFLIETTWQE